MIRNLSSSVGCGSSSSGSKMPSLASIWRCSSRSSLGPIRGCLSLGRMSSRSTTARRVLTIVRPARRSCQTVAASIIGRSINDVVDLAHDLAVGGLELLEDAAALPPHPLVLLDLLDVEIEQLLGELAGVGELAPEQLGRDVIVEPLLLLGALHLAQLQLVHPHHRLAQDADELDDARGVDDQDVVVAAQLGGTLGEVQGRQDRVVSLLLD